MIADSLEVEDIGERVSPVGRIEKLFISKGMKGGTGGGKDPKYIYIFKNEC